jgi:hypothetical protein
MYAGFLVRLTHKPTSSDVTGTGNLSQTVSNETANNQRLQTTDTEAFVLID